MSRGRRKQIEVCWRFVDSSDRLLECALYRTAAGLELCCGFESERPIRWQLVEIYAALAIAEEWKNAIREQGGFTELTTH